ncbi:Enteropeptidase [Echinococcus granulosus]|uniref:Enteropeptidase n=1 Tax=Echinococcus granulosus TaxID=6210 RepID=A0A068WMA4_ECHGR|nr:Enteropeptidase [Echinococcus granulosus]CDS21266.1 enteropeptidase [Echinococcus granulosus]
MLCAYIYTCNLADGFRLVETMALLRFYLGLSLIFFLTLAVIGKPHGLLPSSNCYCNGTNYCRMEVSMDRDRARPYCYYSPYPASKNLANRVLYPSPVLYFQRNTCGLPPFWRRKVMLKIIGGQRALLHSWPWMAGIYLLEMRRDRKRGPYNTPGVIPLCGASLISPRHLITAAHCVLTFNLTTVLSVPVNHWFPPLPYLQAQIIVRLGDHYLGRVNEMWQEDILVDEILIYPSGTNFLESDIAILKLKRPVEFSTGVQPVCIPPPNFELAAGTECYAVGWGLTEKFFEQVPKELMETKIPIVSTAVCKIHSKYVKEGFHTCAGGQEKNPRHGDSGGGLYCKLHEDDDQWYLYGVTSFATSLHGPCAFVYVPRFTEWIHRHVLE